jgi:hypothetical protein
MSQQEYPTSSRCDNTSMLWARVLRDLTTSSIILSCSAITSMTRQHCHQHDSASTSCRSQVTSVALLPAWLDSIVAIKTQQHCCQHDSASTSHHDKVTLVAPSPVWLGSIIASMTRPLHHTVTSHLGSIITIMTWQHCRQYDSASTSHRGQVISAVSSPSWLSSIVASMTQHLHHAAAKSLRQRHHQYDSTAPSWAWLDTYIMLWPSRLGSAIASIT